MGQTITIYSITHDRAVIYVGQTVNFKARKARHKCMAKKYDASHHHANYRSHLARYMHNIDADQFEFNELGTAENQLQADALEERCITLMRPTFNNASGGRSTFTLDARKRVIPADNGVTGRRIVINKQTFRSIDAAARRFKTNHMSIRHRLLSPKNKWDHYKLVDDK